MIPTLPSLVRPIPSSESEIFEEEVSENVVTVHCSKTREYREDGNVQSSPVPAPRPSAAECGESHVLLWKGVSRSFVLLATTSWCFHCLASMCNLLTAVMQFPIPFLSLHAELAAEDEEKRQSPEAALGTIYAVSRAKGG